MSDHQKVKTNKTDSRKNDLTARVLSVSDVSLKSQDGQAGSAQDFAVWIRALRQNWRQGTVGCQGRSDVSRTNKKPWKQKGTGRARAGSARSPLWRGGGVVFGPQPRSKTLTVNRRQKSKVLCALASQFLSEKRVALLPWQMESDTPRTSYAYGLLKNNGLVNKKVTLFVEKSDDMAFRSFRNIVGVKVVSFDQPNAYHLVDSDHWVVLNKDLELFKEMVTLWT